MVVCLVQEQMKKVTRFQTSLFTTEELSVLGHKKTHWISMILKRSLFQNSQKARSWPKNMF